MPNRRRQLLALVLAAPLWTAAPAAFAQQAPVADTASGELDGDQQKMLDLINQGMDLDAPANIPRPKRSTGAGSAKRRSAMVPTG